MMMTIRAHYDGKVFVPDEPVILDAGLKVVIPVPSRDNHAESVESLLAKLPLVHLPPGVAREIAEDPDLDIEES